MELTITTRTLEYFRGERTAPDTHRRWVAIEDPPRCGSELVAIHAEEPA